MRLTAEEIELRTPLWWALSDLMLDTDLPDTWGKHIAAAMLASHFTISQTEAIFLQEVGPAFAFNLFAVAGEWEGWDAAFVEERVSGSLRRRYRRHRLVAIVLRRSLRSQWERILPHIERELATGV